MKPTVIAACLLAAGCATAPQETEQQRVQRMVDRYAPECRLAGYTMGTQPFNDCVVVAYQRDQKASDAQRRAAAAALLSSGAYRIQPNVTPLPQIEPLRQPTNCQTTYLGGTARTTCY